MVEFASGWLPGRLSTRLGRPVKSICRDVVMRRHLRYIDRNFGAALAHNANKSGVTGLMAVRGKNTALRNGPANPGACEMMSLKLSLGPSFRPRRRSSGSPIGAVLGPDGA
jgi:hypothetical protein